ncbi:hypothetical protein SAMN02745857_03804 [Andreprevotia lacus DSM 23236]|jgi:hypothetical protein|uniref:Uncharacterized protein n=1 Tax=Andreprevotia lacus DSM 23236 TaxID=1121001 RepID=A0A1W1Y0V3_9NEIS|nr:hypothetical protein [Andreprevotia lacus]SMC29388.1 hypothetical protein SAMN02745857_03804 [Andreprevotia lacus DSM 23236]
MSESTFFISLAAVRNLKHEAERHGFGISSAHLSEAIAAALGFKTHAALRASLASRSTVEVPKPSNVRLIQRLRELGYTGFPEGVQLVPTLEQSYSPFRNLPLRKSRSVRWTAWRNLIVAAVNAGIEQRLFGLSPAENWWPGAAPDSHECAGHTYRFTVDQTAAAAYVDAISGDELSVYVVLNPRDESIKPHLSGGLSHVDAYAHAWIERRLGAWMQDGGEDFSCKRAVQTWLAQLTITPNGYSDQGSFIL